MKILLIILALLTLSACSFRGWDPPNHNQSLYLAPSPESFARQCANIQDAQINDFKA